jgi:hypothetical protein
LLLEFDWDVLLEYRVHVLFFPAKMPQQVFEERRKVIPELKKRIFSAWRVRVQHGFNYHARTSQNELRVTLMIVRVLLPMHVIGEPIPITTVQNSIFLPSMFDKRRAKSVEMSHEQLHGNARFFSVIVNVY